MKNRVFFFISILFLLSFKSDHSNIQKNRLIKQVESIISKDTLGGFNGVVLIVNNDKVLYQCAKGYADFERKKPMKMSNHFVIGSISKQITAALILRLYEQGKLQLNVPVNTYLDDIKMTWADSITISHLLTHTHGVYSKHVASSFQAGKGFNYTFANFGYGLLDEIIEKVTGQSFAKVSQDLFKELGMKQTFHPAFYNKGILPKGYANNDSGGWHIEEGNIALYEVAAGKYISTANDLLIWNRSLHGGKVLKPATLSLMLTPKESAVRNHGLFGTTYYGYGPTIDTKDSILQYGQTGYCPGFVSMNFYYPETKSSVIILKNVDYQKNDFNETFYFHMALWKCFRRFLISSN